MTTSTITPNLEPSNPSPSQLVEETQSVSIATPRQLMLRKFLKHRVAVISVIVLATMYVMAIFAGFLSPYDPNAYSASYKFLPPMSVSFIDENGHLSWPPRVYKLIQQRDSETLRITYKTDETTWYPVQFFVKGAPYKLFSLIDMDIHLFGLGKDAKGMPIAMLGTDRLGRDMFSRILFGGQVSLSIGLVSVFLSVVLGIVLGGISGYYGGAVDTVIQRIIEFIRSLPSLPLWMALSAALPPDMPQESRYFGITIILSVIGWTSLGRQVRGRFLALRTEDFVLAARLSGASDWRIIIRHMVPSFTSHIIASLTLSIPGIILAETSLSFLGLGLRQPAISWGVLLQEAQNIRTVALSPWLLLPGVAVVITVLAFNFLGDGLRDAADPFNR